MKPVYTPPMGWNSWNTFAKNIDEKMIMETADIMVESGLLDCGYNYLVIDDCWALKERDENGKRRAKSQTNEDYSLVHWRLPAAGYFEQRGLHSYSSSRCY